MTPAQRLATLAPLAGGVPFLGEDVAPTIPNFLQHLLSGRQLSGAQRDFTLRLILAATIGLLEEPRPVFPHRVAIGRIVHFVLLTGTRAGHVRPAMVTTIHGETCIHVCVNPDPQDDPISREVETKVQYSPLGEPGTWHWPGETARQIAFAPAQNTMTEPPSHDDARNVNDGQGGTLLDLTHKTEGISPAKVASISYACEGEVPVRSADVPGGATAASAERLHDPSSQALAATSPIPNPDTVCS